MKLNVIVLIACSITIKAKSQRVITLRPNGEIKEFSDRELKGHLDMNIDGNRMVFFNSGQIKSELYIKNGHRNGYTKLYENGILVALKLYKDDVPIGTHYFWDDKGILKKSITYKNGKEVASKEY